MTVRDVVAAALLVVGCGAQVIACLGVATMRQALDRLHCVTFAAIACGYRLPPRPSRLTVSLIAPSRRYSWCW